MFSLSFFSSCSQGAFAQVDWNDFVVVETLTFDDSETNLPGPISLAELGERLIEVLLVLRPSFFSFRFSYVGSIC